MQTTWHLIGVNTVSITETGAMAIGKLLRHQKNLMLITYIFKEKCLECEFLFHSAERYESGSVHP